MATITQKIFTVSEVTGHLKKTIESQFSSIRVQGEISNLKMQSSGHIYFTLKDQEAQLSAALFRGFAKNLSELPKIGDRVIIYGDITVYPPRGNYQIIVRHIEYSGIGQLLMQLHQLKEQLYQRGWLDPKLKKTLPKYPQTIGVVTSPTGAVIQDIIHVLSRRFKGFQLLLYPVAVQGKGAEHEIAEAINFFNRHRLCDVLIVGRGGGSLEDLWPFNELVVATAIHHSVIPIVSAVGHETDYSITDLVADVRAPTPSAAAEIVMHEKKAQLDFLTSSAARLENFITQKLLFYREKHTILSKNPYLKSPYLLLGPHMQKLDDKKESLVRHAKYLTTNKKMLLDSLQKQLNQQNPIHHIREQQLALQRAQQQIYAAMQRLFSQKKQGCHTLQIKYDKQCKIYQNRLKNFFNEKNTKIHLLNLCLMSISQKKKRLLALKSHMHSLDPGEILKRGYCIPFNENKDSIIINASDIAPDDRLNLYFHDGLVETTARRISKENLYDPKQ